MAPDHHHGSRMSILSSLGEYSSLRENSPLRKKLRNFQLTIGLGRGDESETDTFASTPSVPENQVQPAAAADDQQVNAASDAPPPPPSCPSRRLRARASREPPIIPPEVLIWSSGSPANGPKKRRRANNPIAAREKLARLGYHLGKKHRQVATGTKVRLFRTGVEAVVQGFDSVGCRYWLKPTFAPEGLEDDQSFWEVLHGPGYALWDLLAEPAAEPEQPSTSVAQERTSTRISASSEAAGPCPICLCDVRDDIGVMPCCGKVLHVRCALEWRGSNLKPGHIYAKQKAPETHVCCWCKAPCEGGASSRRMFSWCPSSSELGVI